MIHFCICISSLILKLYNWRSCDFPRQGPEAQDALPGPGRFEGARGEGGRQAQAPGRRRGGAAARGGGMLKLQLLIES